MKKRYKCPEMEVSQLDEELVLAASGITSSSDDINIGYGGIDEEGSLDPSVKGDNNLDFEW